MSEFENRAPENEETTTASQQTEEAPLREPSNPVQEAPAYQRPAPHLTLEPDLEPDIPLPKAPEPEPIPAPERPPQWQAPPPRQNPNPYPDPSYNAYPGQQAPPQYQPPRYDQPPQYTQPQYNQPPQPSYYPPQYNQSPMGYVQKSRLAAGLLAILLGVFGVHNFYLGFKNRAAIQLIVSLVVGMFTCGLSTVAVVIWSFIEGVLILSASPSFLYDGNGVILRD